MKIKQKHITPALQEALEGMLWNPNLNFYYYFLTYIDFYETEFIPPEPKSMCATVIDLKLAILYDSEFVQKHTRKEIMFTLLHELFHLIHNHLERGRAFHPIKANLAMDMIINKLIGDHHGKDVISPVLTQAILDKEIEECKAKNLPIDPERLKKAQAMVGKTYLVQLDPAYKGDLVFEPLYSWLEAEQKKEKQGKKSALSQDTKDLLNDADKMGMTFDYHGELDEVSEEVKKQAAQDIIQKAKIAAKERGMTTGGMEEILQLLLKQPKQNNLRILKRAISAIKGKTKTPSYRRLNIRSIEGMKGRVKESNEINALWDVSGSMQGEHDLVISQLFRDNYVINLIQVDTQVNCTQKIKNKMELTKLKLKGNGGTILQPGIEYVLNPKNKLNKFPTVILTDGYCDQLNFKGTMAQFLILTTGVDVKYSSGRNVRQIKLVR
jgi:predicted metal-dependent peptidase